MFGSFFILYFVGIKNLKILTVINIFLGFFYFCGIKNGIKNLKKLLTNIPIWNIVTNRVSTLYK